MKNKYVAEIVVETDLKLTKKRVRAIISEALEALPDGMLERFRVRSVDRD